MVCSIAYLTLTILCSRFQVHAVRSQDDLEGRIIDGEYVKISNHPHAVFLEVIRPADDYVHICGSSVVNQNFLVTAAHCFSEEDRGRKDVIMAYAGHENLSKTNIVRKTRLPIVHEKFDTDAVENDIALVYLAKELPLGKRIKRIIIMRSFPRNTKGTIAGWGIINDITNEDTMLLKALTHSVRGHKECSRVLSGPGKLCAGTLRPSDPRPAKGDSGSGLITGNYILTSLCPRLRPREFRFFTNPEGIVDFWFPFPLPLPTFILTFKVVCYSDLPIAVDLGFFKIPWELWIFSG